MYVELHNNLREPAVLAATRVLLTADDGTPIAFAVDYSHNHWRVFHAGDPEFAEQLQAHGFDRTVVVARRAAPRA